MFQNDIISHKTETKLGRKKVTTADYIGWSQVQYVINHLKKQKDYSMVMFIGLGSYMGLRYSDVVKLRWNDILNHYPITLTEQKTGKIKKITINPDLKLLAESVYRELPSKTEYIVVNRFGQPISIQYLNRRLKEIRLECRLKIDNISCHSFRKSFGRRIYENNFNSEHALVLLSDIFNHSSVAITRKYLGLRSEEIANVYLNL